MAVSRLPAWQGPLWGGATGRNPTDRGKCGTKQSLLTEADGGPLAILVAPANRNDHLLLRETLEAVVIERPAGEQHLCLDAGYDYARVRAALPELNYQEHIRAMGTEKLDEQGEKQHPARRWVVERTFGWLCKWRGILVRYEKRAENYLGCLMLACAIIWYRRWWRLTN